MSDRIAVQADLRLIPEPWEYNPSKWRQRIAVALVATPAFLIAVYMGLYQWRLIDGVWDPIFGEQTLFVLDSAVSHRISGWVLIPDSILGALAYLGDIIFAMAGSTRRWQYRPWLVIVFGLDVIPLGIISAVLVVLQGAVVGSWCFLCLVTAVISLLLAYLAFDEVLSCLRFLGRVRRRARREQHRGLLWQTIWGHPSEIAEQEAVAMASAPKASAPKPSAPKPSAPKPSAPKPASQEER